MSKITARWLAQRRTNHAAHEKGGFFTPASSVFFFGCHASESAALRTENLKVQNERLWISAASWLSQVGLRQPHQRGR